MEWRTSARRRTTVPWSVVLLADVMRSTLHKSVEFETLCAWVVFRKGYERPRHGRVEEVRGGPPPGQRLATRSGDRPDP